MANLTAGKGGVPVQRIQSGESPIPRTQLYCIPSSVSTTVFPGDPMVLNGTANSDGIPQVIVYTAGGGTGVFGFVAEVFDTNRLPLPDASAASAVMTGTASTVRYCTIYGDENIFEIVEDSDTSSLAAADIGLYVDLIGVASNAGNLTENTSGWRIDSSTKNTTATFPLLIRGFAQTDRENDGTATAANKKIRVVMNPILQITA